MSLRLLRVFGPSVQLQLAAEQLEGERKPVWIQAAVEGTWLGHKAHPKIAFSKANFDTLIRNLHANPSFKAGPDGIGCQRVVRLDYEHSSEIPAKTSSDVPAEGRPAPGWVLDLEKRDGTGKNAGKVELWALVEMGETLWGQVQRGEYQWTSVAIDTAALDRVTGAKQGDTLTSLAITNDPFILGMAPMDVRSTESMPSKIAASMGASCIFEERRRGRQPQQILCSLDVWGEAETPLEVVVGMCSIFGLPDESNASAVLAELQKFAAMLEAHTVPEGVDSKHLLCRLQSLLGLPVLVTTSEIISEASRVLGAIENSAAASGGTSTPAPQSAAPNASAAPETTSMTVTKTLTARLANVLKLSNAEDEDAVLDAVKSTLRLRSAIVKVLKLAADADDDKVTEAVESAAADAEVVEAAKEAKDAFEQLQEILESKGMTETLAKATKLSQDAKKYGEVVEQLNALTAKLAKGDVEKAEAEIGAIAACHKVDDRTKRLLSNQVFLRDKDGNATGVNHEALESIRKEWSVPDEARQRLTLTSNVFAGPNGQQKGGDVTGAPPVPGTETLVPSGDGGKMELQKTQEQIRLCAGRNDIERTMVFLSQEKKEAFTSLPRHEQVFLAGQFFRTGQF